MDNENIINEIDNMKKEIEKYKKIKKEDIPKINNKPADEFLQIYINMLENKLNKK